MNPRRFPTSLARPRAATRILAASAALAAAACGLPVDTDDLAGDVDSTAREAITWNAITWNAITWNALTTVPGVSKHLVSQPLSTATFGDAGRSSPAIALRAAVDASAETRLFMDYLVSCALPAGRSVHWQSPYTAASATYKGGLGLCPEWESLSPGEEVSEACQQRVSACLLARNNAFGAKVRLSLRGDRGGGTGFDVSGAVAARGSAPACSWSDDGECGWRPQKVGVADAGTVVLVRRGEPCWGDDVLVRVCPGDSHCSGRAAVATERLSCGEVAAVALDYDTYGGQAVFALSTRPANPRARASKPVTVSAPGAGWVAYPAPEWRVYGFREGAFYGNLFATEALGVQSRLVWEVKRAGYRVEHCVKRRYWIPTPWGGAWFDSCSPWYRDLDELHANEDAYLAYQNMYACSSREWDAATADATMRVCAGPESRQCAATWVGPCDRIAAATPGLCATRNNPATGWLDGDYDDCDDARGRTWPDPLTTYLVSPSDVCPQCANP